MGSRWLSDIASKVLFLCFCHVRWVNQPLPFGSERGWERVTQRSWKQCWLYWILIAGAERADRDRENDFKPQAIWQSRRKSPKSIQIWFRSRIPHRDALPKSNDLDSHRCTRDVPWHLGCPCPPWLVAQDFSPRGHMVRATKHASMSLQPGVAKFVLRRDPTAAAMQTSCGWWSFWSRTWAPWATQNCRTLQPPPTLLGECARSACATEPQHGSSLWRYDFRSRWSGCRGFHLEFSGVI